MGQHALQPDRSTRVGQGNSEPISAKAVMSNASLFVRARTAADPAFPIPSFMVKFDRPQSFGLDAVIAYTVIRW